MIRKIAALIIAGFMLMIPGCRRMRNSVTLTLKSPALPFRTSAADDSVTGFYELLNKIGSSFSEYYMDADVTVNVIIYENAKEIENIDDCYDTGNAADVLLNDYYAMETHIHSGRVVPLDDIISEELRSDIDDVFWEQSILDGRTYMIPYFYRQNVLAYNKELFRKAGLDEYIGSTAAIQAWTTDEWEEILAALRGSMPDTSYPLMMCALDSQGDAHVMCYIRSMGSSIFDEEMRFSLETVQGIAGLQWIKDCVDRRYMPENAGEINLMSNYDMFLNGQLAIFPASALLEESFDMDYGLVNFPSPDGGCSTSFLTGFEVFDNGDPERLRAAKALVEYIYESDFLDYSTAAIPCSRKTREKYPAHMASVKKYIDNAGTTVNFTGGNPNWLGVRSVFYKRMRDLVSGRKTAAEVAAELDADANAAIAEGYSRSALHG